MTFSNSTPGKSDSPAANKNLNAQLADPLSPRELEVLAQLCAGKTNKQIAEALFVSPHTVKSHTVSIYAKLNVTTRTEAALKALQLGTLE